MLVNSVNTVDLTASVTRGYAGTRATGHLSGETVLVGPPNQFASNEPSGSCTATATVVTPVIDTSTGQQWLCSTVLNAWVPGFGNPGTSGVPVDVTAAVASAAGKVTPSGPLFHITGTAAITGFNIPTGYNGGPFCVIPDGIFTTTTANNIALASTAVVSRKLCYSYDGNSSKFYPTY